MQDHVSKEEWVAMFEAIGLSEEAMMKWHQLFESRHPDAHAAFLKWLGISSAEVDRIRLASR